MRRAPAIVLPLAVALAVALGGPARADAPTPQSPPASTASPSELPLVGGTIKLEHSAGGVRAPVLPGLATPGIPHPIEIPPDLTMEMTYSAFQKGYFLTAYAYALDLVRTKKDPHAMSLLGLMFASGLGVKPDMKQAVSWYTQAADGNDPAAMVELARIELFGEVKDRDLVKARDLLSKALALGRKDAEYGLGLIAMSSAKGLQEDDVAAFQHFRAAAENGDGDAAYALASLYEQGLGVARDIREVAHWMGVAASLGSVPGEMEYGIMVYNGDGVKADPELAAKWFLKSAVAGNAIAADRLARLYFVGSGVAKDLTAAAFWNRRAMAGGINDGWLNDQLEATKAGEAGAAVPTPAPAPAPTPAK